MDQGHMETEKLLVALERKIKKVYGEASKEMQKKADAYFAQFVERDKKQQELLKAGKITEQEYKNWRLAQMGRGERFLALRDDLAKRMTEANKVAVSYINDETPGIYSLNHNYAAYEIEQVAGNVGFTLYDEQTVRRLIAEDPTLLPKRRVNAPKDLKWNKKRFTAEITAGILQGESIGKIANRVQNLSDANRSGAIRNARTAVTGAQNAGRQASYDRAKEMGLQLKKRWIATKDNRTRHAHAMLDGQTVPLDKPFQIEGSNLMFPGDPTGRANLVWNCRCTMRTVEKDGIEAEPRQMRVRNPVTGRNEVVSEMTYQEWEAAKRAEDAKAWEIYMHKGRNYSSDRAQYEVYKKVLGSKIPNTFAGFQDLKYNTPDEWKALKTLKKQTEFVKNAACQTTPRKFTGYLLKPGAKHSQDFFDVGYETGNPMQLRYDIAKQFDMEKGVDRVVDKNGTETFNIYMELGVTKKRTFLTGWQIDKPGDVPRIITGFRKEAKQ